MVRSRRTNREITRPRGDGKIGQKYRVLERESCPLVQVVAGDKKRDRKSTRLNSSHGYISYAVFSLKKNKRGMTLVKICGICDVASGIAASEAGADILGFHFCDSPRRITPEEAVKILDELPHGPAQA